MSWIDKIPTIGEVLDFIDCRIGGHDWKVAKDKESRTCSQCGKVERNDFH